MSHTESATSGTTPVLTLDDIHVVHKARTGTLFRRDRVHAVSGVSLDVERGVTTGIVGESGSGKTTLAKVMVGLQTPTKGRIRFAGKELRHGAAARKEFGRQVSVVFQDPSTALNPRMTVRDTLTDPLQVHGVGTAATRARRVSELVHLVGLPQSTLDVLPRQISGGQRQRVAIARALVLEPLVVVLDEPTSALDVSVRAQVLNLLGDLKAQMNLGMVFISHDINTVRQVSDRIAVMNSGRIVELADTAAIFDHPSDNYTRTLLAAAPTLLSRTTPKE